MLLFSRNFTQENRTLIEENRTLCMKIAFEKAASASVFHSFQSKSPHCIRWQIPASEAIAATLILGSAKNLSKISFSISAD